MSARNVSQLCSYCSTIDFSILTLPFISEVEELWQGVMPTGSGFFQRDLSSLQTPGFQLGTVGRIIENREECDLCRIFGDVIATRSDVLGSRMIVVRPLEKPDLLCWADYAPIREFGSYGFRVCNLNLCIGEDYKETSLARAWACLGTSQVDNHQTRSSMIEHGAAPSLFFATRFCTPQLDPDLLRGWMNLCKTQHQLTCRSSLDLDIGSHTINSPQVSLLSSESDTLRLIDVVRRCIVTVKLTDRLEYAALSYVWGGLQPLTYTQTSNIDLLQKPNSLPDNVLPQTIADFLNLVRSLEIPYAWVDALCILQDDEHDMAKQIESMSQIYNNAFVTVINAGGDNITAGLPGVRAGTRSMRQEEITVPLQSGLSETGESAPETITLMTTLSRTDGIHRTQKESSKWFTRAWTYQERLLSARTLIFNPEQVSWICPGARFSEDSIAECEQDFVRPIAFDPTIDMWLSKSLRSEETSNVNNQEDEHEIWQQYAYYVGAYSGRDLSYLGDVHNAFRGIEQNVTQRTGEQIIWGLPASHIDLAIGWDTFNIINAPGIRRRKEPSTSKVAPQMKNIVFPSWSWMGWIGRISMSTFVQQDAGHAASVRCHVHLTTPKVSIEPVSGNIATAKEEMNDPIDSPISLDIISEHYPYLTSDVLEQITDRTLLFFWSETSHFRIEWPATPTDGKKSDTSSKAKLAILDANGEKVGECCTPSPDEPQANTTLAQFVIIETHQDQYNEFYGTSAEVRVLQIREQASENQTIKVKGLYERVNIGLISQSAWIASSPRRKLIALG